MDITKSYFGRVQELLGFISFGWKELSKVVPSCENSSKREGKLGHFLGSILKKKDLRFNTWEKEDSIIMVWLWNSML